MKKIILIIASLIIFSCTNGNNNFEEVNKQNEQIVKQYFDYFNNHQWQKLANMYSDNAEFKDPAVGNKAFPMNHTEFTEKYTLLNSTFPNIKANVVKTYFSGDKYVIVEFLTTGTAPDNSSLELPICTIFTIENGKIAKDFSYYNNF